MGQIKVVVHQDAEILRKDFSLGNSEIHFFLTGQVHSH